jgi:hypothetical protein
VAATTSISGATVQSTRTLLLCCVIAGPLRMIVSRIQAFMRAGLDITRHVPSVC